MKYYHLFEIVFPACYLAIAGWMMFTAARGLLLQRAALISARISFVLTSLFLVPIFLYCTTIVLYGPRNSAPDWNEFGMAAIPLTLLLCWRLMTGFTVIGANRRSVNEVLQAIARSKNWEFRHGLLPALRGRQEEQLVLAGRPWLWFGIITAGGKGGGRALRGLEEEFRSRLCDYRPAFESRAYLLQFFLGFVLSCTGVGMYFLA